MTMVSGLTSNTLAAEEFTTNRHSVNQGDEADVTIWMNTTETKFGFSISGGGNTFMYPRIDAISPDSACSRADLRIGDEVVCVNGSSLQHASHEHIITAIHKSIRSRVVQLRVRREDGGFTYQAPTSLKSSFGGGGGGETFQLREISHDKKPPLATSEGDYQTLDHTPPNSQSASTTTFGAFTPAERIDPDQLTPTESAPAQSVCSSEPDSDLCSEPDLSAAGAQPGLLVAWKSTDHLNITPPHSRHRSAADSTEEDSEIEFRPVPDIERIRADMQHKLKPRAAATAARQQPPPPTSTGLQFSSKQHPTDMQRMQSKAVEEDWMEQRRRALLAPGGHDMMFTPRMPELGSPSSRFREMPVDCPPADDIVETNLSRSGSSHFGMDTPQHDTPLHNLQPLDDEAGLYSELDELANHHFIPEFSPSSTDSEAGRRHRAYADLATLERGHISTEDTNYDSLDVELLSQYLAELPSAAASSPVSELISHLDSDVLRRSVAHFNVINQSRSTIRRSCSAAGSTTDGDLLPTALEVQEMLHSQDPSSRDAVALYKLLDQHNVKALFQAHDKLLSSRSDKTLTIESSTVSELPTEVIDKAGGLRLVTLHKSRQPLGATILKEGDDIVIGRIVKGGAVEQSGAVHEGDTLLRVNDLEIHRGMSIDDVCHILSACTGRRISLLLRPAAHAPSSRNGHEEHTEVLHVRALFDFDPADDDYVPCRELGLPFERGTVLHVLTRDDPNWWQAVADGGHSDSSLAGLIPSKAFWHKREALRIAIETADENLEPMESRGGGGILCRRKKRRRLQAAHMNGGHAHINPWAIEVLTYEEVGLLQPGGGHPPRPVVLVGPSRIGRHDLRTRLFNHHPDRFAPAVAHTTRPKRPGERDGLHFHFVSKPVFKAELSAGSIVDWSEYDKHWYGTSVSAIKAVSAASKSCVLSLHPRSVPALRDAGLMPFVLFIAPPGIDQLRAICRRRSNKTLKDSELRGIIEEARELDLRFGHWFDAVLVNSDSDDTCYSQLLALVHAVHTEPQWVPVSWTAAGRRPHPLFADTD